MVDECSICFQGSKRKIVCPFCAHSACLQCTEKYLQIQFPWECMNCHASWSATHVDTLISKTFRKQEEKKQLERRLLHREKAWMDETRRLLERNRWEREEKITELSLLRKERRGLLRRLQTLVETIQNLSRQVEFLEEANHHVLSDKSRVDRRCSVETCPGYLTVRDGACTCCGETYCTQCLEPLREDTTTKGVRHSCHPDQLESIMVIHRETKPCPQCRVPIQKSEGCDQMWCTQCHTAFDWTLLHVIPLSHLVHPPPVPHSPLKGNRVSVHLLEVFFQQHPLWAPEIQNDMMTFFREMEDIRRRKLPALQKYLFQDPFMATMRDRIEYLEGRLTETEFTRYLVRREVSIGKRQETFQQLHAKAERMEESLGRLWGCQSVDDVRNHVLEMGKECYEK